MLINIIISALAGGTFGYGTHLYNQSQTRDLEEDLEAVCDEDESCKERTERHFWTGLNGSAFGTACYGLLENYAVTLSLPIAIMGLAVLIAKKFRNTHSLKSVPINLLPHQQLASSTDSSTASTPATHYGALQGRMPALQAFPEPLHPLAFPQRAFNSGMSPFTLTPNLSALSPSDMPPGTV